MQSDLAKSDAVILCGGLGTRLQQVLKDRPKVLAPFGSRAFLDLLLERLIAAGVRRFVFSTGHLGEKVEKHIKERYGARKELEFAIVKEPEPLGTGGGLKCVLSKVRSDPFLVLNGDSLYDFGLDGLFHFHRKHAAPVSIVLIKEVRPDGGGVALEASGRVVSFNEKETTGLKLMNGGVYIMNKEVERHMPPQNVFSLEYDFFPALAQSGMCFGLPVEGKVYDIGTPERYQEVERLFHEG